MNKDKIEIDCFEDAALRWAEIHHEDKDIKQALYDAVLFGVQLMKNRIMEDALESRVTITSGGLLFDDLRTEDVDYADKVKLVIASEE